MDVTLLEQPPAHCLPGAALEQHVIRHHDGGAPVDLEQSPHVLQEVQLLVAGGGPEVGTLHNQGLPFRLALGIDEGEAGLATKGRVGQHHVEVDARMIAQAVIDDDVGPVPADAVQVQVHDTQPGGAIDNLPTVEGMVPQVGQLALVHVPVVLPDVLVGHQQESVGPAGRIAD